MHALFEILMYHSNGLWKLSQLHQAVKKSNINYFQIGAPHRFIQTKLQQVVMEHVQNLPHAQDWTV